MVRFETPSLFITHSGGCGGGLMARINDHDRSSELSTGDLHLVSDPNGPDIRCNNNNINNIPMVVHIDQEDSRTKEEDGKIAIGSNDNNVNNTKALTTDPEEDHKDWLRLGTGPDTAKLRDFSGNNGGDSPAEGVRSDQGLLELSLFSSSMAAAAGTSGVFHAPPSSSQPPQSHHHQVMVMRGGSGTSFYYHHQQMFRPPPLMLQHNPSFVSSISSSTSCLSSSSSLPPSFSPWMPMMGQYHFQPSLGFNTNINRTSADLEVGPSSEFRVVDPPRRPHSGVWFVLQASQNQAKEPFLPQVNKSYLRIKDGRITVRLLIKYLMKKLQLDSESEIEIRCRGQQLSPFLTMQHVRDTIWSAKDSSLSSSSSSSSSVSFTLLPESTTDHVMILHYGRSP